MPLGLVHVLLRRRTQTLGLPEVRGGQQVPGVEGIRRGVREAPQMKTSSILVTNWNTSYSYTKSSAGHGDGPGSRDAESEPIRRRGFPGADARPLLRTLGPFDPGGVHVRRHVKALGPDRDLLELHGYRRAPGGRPFLPHLFLFLRQRPVGAQRRPGAKPGPHRTHSLLTRDVHLEHQLLHVRHRRCPALGDRPGDAPSTELSLGGGQRGSLLRRRSRRSRGLLRGHRVHHGLGLRLLRGGERVQGLLTHQPLVRGGLDLGRRLEPRFVVVAAVAG